MTEHFFLAFRHYIQLPDTESGKRV